MNAEGARRAWISLGHQTLKTERKDAKKRAAADSSPSVSAKTRWWPTVTHPPEGVQLLLQACAGAEPQAVLVVVEVVPARCSSSTPMRLLVLRCPRTLF